MRSIRRTPGESSIWRTNSLARAGESPSSLAALVKLRYSGTARNTVVSAKPGLGMAYYYSVIQHSAFGLFRLIFAAPPGPCNPANEGSRLMNKVFAGPILHPLAKSPVSASSNHGVPKTARVS